MSIINIPNNSNDIVFKYENDLRNFPKKINKKFIIQDLHLNEFNSYNFNWKYFQVINLRLDPIVANEDYDNLPVNVKNLYVYDINRVNLLGDMLNNIETLDILQYNKEVDLKLFKNVKHITFHSLNARTDIPLNTVSLSISSIHDNLSGLAAINEIILNFDDLKHLKKIQFFNSNCCNYLL